MRALVRIGLCLLSAWTWPSFVSAGEIKPYQSKEIPPYQSRPIQQHHGKSIHVLTPEERARMRENDRKAGRTRNSIKGNPAGGTGAPGYSPCAPNCGYNYNTGQPAPTIYSPFHNYY